MTKPRTRVGSWTKKLDETTQKNKSGSKSESTKADNPCRKKGKPTKERKKGPVPPQKAD